MSDRLVILLVINTYVFHPVIKIIELEEYFCYYEANG